MTKLIGLEAEYLLPRHDIAEVLGLGIPEVHPEFFRCMVEIVTQPRESAGTAVDELAACIERLQAPGIRLGRYASFPTSRPAPTMADVTQDTPYYHWVFHDACERLGVHPVELRHVGIHVNLSDSDMSEDQLIRATNLLRCLNFLFILLTANSPFSDGRPCGALSRRMRDFPNRYDVPLWESAQACRAWLATEEDAGKIYRGKARCWMTVCPRPPHNNLSLPFERIELRSLDGGLGVPLWVVEGCCELAQRLVDYGRDARSLPVQLEELRENDQAVARLGRAALVSLGGARIPALEIARYWCAGIPALEEVLANGSPAERALAKCGRAP